MPSPLSATSDTFLIRFGSVPCAAKTTFTSCGPAVPFRKTYPSGLFIPGGGFACPLGVNIRFCVMALAIVTPSTSEASKPGFWATTTYLPSGRVIEYNPPLSLFISVVFASARFTARTVAPATTPPFLSRTMPRSAPLLLCGALRPLPPVLAVVVVDVCGGIPLFSSLLRHIVPHKISTSASHASISKAVFVRFRHTVRQIFSISRFPSFLNWSCFASRPLVFYDIRHPFHFPF